MLSLKKGTTIYRTIVTLVAGIFIAFSFMSYHAGGDRPLRQHISINDGWRFMKYDSRAEADRLIYDVRQ